MQDNAMAKRFDWSGAAKEYEALYYRITQGRKV
jgi:glycogen synthase